MSSILKALKKIETSGVSEDTRGYAAPYKAQATLPSRRAAKWYTRRRTLLVLTTVLLTAGAAAYFGWSSSKPAPPAAGAAREIRSPLPASQTSPAPLNSPRTASPDPAAPPIPSARSTEKGAGPATAGAQARMSPPVQAPPPSSRIRPRDSGGTGAPETRSAAAQRSASSAVPAGTSRSPSSRSAADSLDRLEESKLKVMAIAWFDDPARRLAVVNGHIVREGESVEGYNVTQIRKDDIIVNDGSRTWRVELNLKTQP
ncbi:MAG: hypothetical protein ACM3KE_18205 [Hyphomicrobiales bacterium]